MDIEMIYLHWALTVCMTRCVRPRKPLNDQFHILI